MLSEFRMNFSPEVMLGVVEQIREEIENECANFADEASEHTIESVRLTIELELAQRTKLPELVSEAEAKLRDYVARQLEYQWALLEREAKMEALNKLVSEEDWFNKTLESFMERWSKIGAEIAAERFKPPSI